MVGNKRKANVKAVANEPTSLDAKLTEKEMRFVEYYVKDNLSQTESARRAGYDHARQEGYRLIRRKHVADKIVEMQDDLRQRARITPERSLNDLMKIRDKAYQEGSYNASIGAEKLRLQIAGLLVDKKEIKTGKIDQMTREEVMKELEKLHAIAEENTIDITATSPETE